jgi:hypothetical protein
MVRVDETGWWRKPHHELHKAYSSQKFINTNPRKMRWVLHVAYSVDKKKRERFVQRYWMKAYRRPCK